MLSCQWNFAKDGTQAASRVPWVAKKWTLARSFPTPGIPFRVMTKLLRSAPLILIALMTLCSSGCKTKAGPAGSTKVVGPFSGSKYESNNAWFRGTGQGTSVNQSIARGKADIDAKNQLAGQVSTNMRAVTDQYLGQTENAGAADVADKFQSLVREVMNTGLADLRKIGEETYVN